MYNLDYETRGSFVASYPDSILNFRGRLISSLLKSGFYVHVAAPNFADLHDDVQKLKEMGVFVHDLNFDRTGTNPFKDLSTLYSLYQLMIKTKPGVILVYTIKPVIYGLIAAWLARVPNRYAIITGLGYTFTDTRKSKTLLKFIVRFLYRLSIKTAKKVFFQNSDDQLLFHKLKITNQKRQNLVLVNGSGVDLDKFNVAPFPSEIHFLMICRFLVGKGIREYAEAAKIVKKRYPNVKFDLVGWLDDNPDSIEKNELESWIVSGNINYLGEKKDVRPSISNCSVYVLPSYREGIPRTVLEAMAMGRPIVTTDAPGCRETVDEGKNGFKVDVQSVDQLVDKLSLFIQRPELIKKMGECSRKMVEIKFDVDKVNKVMLEEMDIKAK